MKQWHARKIWHMQQRHSIKISGDDTVCNDDTKEWYTIKIRDKDMQYRYANNICNKDMQWSSATDICNEGKRYRYAIKIWKEDIT